MYGIDTWDSSLYDLVIHIKKITVDDATDIICHTVGLEHFQKTPDSQKAMDDLVLAAEVKAALIDTKPDIEVSAQDGVIYVKTKVAESEEAELYHKMENIAKAIPGVKELKVHARPIQPYGD